MNEISLSKIVVYSFHIPKDRNFLVLLYCINVASFALFNRNKLFCQTDYKIPNEIFSINALIFFEDYESRKTVK